MQFNAIAVAWRSWIAIKRQSRFYLLCRFFFTSGLQHAFVLFSDSIAQPAPGRCRFERVWDFPTSILQSKVRVCAAERSNESPSGAFKRQNGLRQQMEGLRPDKFADVYTSALLAAMVLVLRSSQPVSDTDAQAYTSSNNFPVLPTLAAVERVYSLDAEM